MSPILHISYESLAAFVKSQITEGIPHNDCSIQLECYSVKKDPLLRPQDTLSSSDQSLLSKAKQVNLPSHHCNSLVITLEREYQREKENLKHSICSWVFSSLVSLSPFQNSGKEIQDFISLGLISPLGGYT